MSCSPVRLRPAGGAAEWDRLVDRAEGATAFHRYAWLQDVSALLGWRFRPLVVERAGEAIGVLPVLARRALPISPSMPFPYAGPLVPDELLPETIAVLRRWQLRHLHLVAELSFAPGRRGPAGGPSVVEQRTYELDLAHGDPEVYVRGLHRDRRKGLRRAARLGLEHRPAAAADVRRVLPGLLESAYGRRDGRSPYPPVQTADWIAERLDDGDPRIFAEVVLDGGEAIALLVGLRDGDRAYGWIGGALPAQQATGAGSLVYDAVIRRLMAEGVTRLDLVGHVDDGVARFKRTLGAVEVPYLDARSSLLPGAVEHAGRRAWTQIGGRLHPVLR